MVKNKHAPISDTFILDYAGFMKNQLCLICIKRFFFKYLEEDQRIVNI